MVNLADIRDCGTCMWWREFYDYMPYGAIYLRESRSGECELGYPPMDCPTETWKPNPTKLEKEARNVSY